MQLGSFMGACLSTWATQPAPCYPAVQMAPALGVVSHLFPPIQQVGRVEVAIGGLLFLGLPRATPSRHGAVLPISIQIWPQANSGLQLAVKRVGPPLTHIHQCWLPQPLRPLVQSQMKTQSIHSSQKESVKGY